jgi:hypothetical protein
MTDNDAPRLRTNPDPDRRGGRITKGSRTKGSPLSLAEMKARQTSKLRQLADALIAAGFETLAEQAEVLGLSRSTTWTILGASHKGSGLSSAIANRILAAPGLPKPVRSILEEYVTEKTAGLYGGSMAQRRGFAERLSSDAAKPVISEEVDLEQMSADQAAPKRSRDGGPHGTLASSKLITKRHISLKDHLRQSDSGAEHLGKSDWEKCLVKNEVKCWPGVKLSRRGRPKSELG